MRSSGSSSSSGGNTGTRHLSKRLLLLPPPPPQRVRHHLSRHIATVCRRYCYRRLLLGSILKSERKRAPGLKYEIDSSLFFRIVPLALSFSPFPPGMLGDPTECHAAAPRSCEWKRYDCRGMRDFREDVGEVSCRRIKRKERDDQEVEQEQSVHLQKKTHEPKVKQ